MGTWLTLTDEDGALSEAIVEAVEARDRALVVQRLRAFYGDQDRTDRAPRALLVLHLGLVTGLLDSRCTVYRPDHNGECLNCDEGPAAHEDPADGHCPCCGARVG